MKKRRLCYTLKSHNSQFKNMNFIHHNNACSSLLCAFSQVPMFVQTQQKWRRMYAGECQGPGVRTDFEMVHLRKVPSQYNHLSGLLDVFKSKMVSVMEQDGFEKKGVWDVQLRLLGTAFPFGWVHSSSFCLWTVTCIHLLVHQHPPWPSFTAALTGL